MKFGFFPDGGTWTNRMRAQTFHTFHTLGAESFQTTEWDFYHWHHTQVNGLPIIYKLNRKILLFSLAEVCCAGSWCYIYLLPLWKNPNEPNVCPYSQTPQTHQSSAVVVHPFFFITGSLFLGAVNKEHGDRVFSSVAGAVQQEHVVAWAICDVSSSLAEHMDGLLWELAADDSEHVCVYTHSLLWGAES